ncbi:MmgE/PrpD family protein [Orrella marina]|uniref:MmgE/PrpD family protein n=1 Tax=Orrella marina TaxID=2163011 RepID=A0A2R4XI64_9BURK|nr:MmgE/PrpD family protein [Orrella marina]AWB33478.1 MmgE/PrpD family protein [Orrella marina]
MTETSVPAPGQSISEQIAAYAAEFDASHIPREAQARARELMLDATGIALASHGYPFSERAMAAIASLNAGGQSAVIGSATRLDIRNAALMNGILIHGLDYDDTHARGVIHATSSIFPTVMSLAADLNRSVQDMVSAYVLGVEVATRLGSVVKGGFHQVGFHPTGLIGAFGCTVAAGWLLGLNEQQLVDAQGLVLSMGAGSMEFLEDGAWNKRMHPGWAAVSGITAATLGKHGYKGTRLAYEGRFGLYRSHLGEHAACDLALATQGLSKEWEVTQISVKPMPACHFTHAAVDAAIRIHRQGVRPQDIERIEVLIPQEVIKTVCEPQDSKRKPANSYEAQFSIPYLVGTALVHGRLTLDDIDPPALFDPAVLALAQRIDYRADPDSAFPKYYDGEVIVQLRDGTTIREREPVNRGASDRPLSRDDICIKFRDNAHRQVSPERAEVIESLFIGSDAGMSARALAESLGQTETVSA